MAPVNTVQPHRIRPPATQAMVMMPACTNFKATFSVLCLLIVQISQYQIIGSDASLPVKDVVVLDDVFTSGELNNLREFLSHEETFWTFEPFVKHDFPFSSASHPWSTVLDFESLRALRNSSIWRKVESAFNTAGALFPYKAEGQISVRGDHIKCSSCDREGYSATVFLEQNWTPNWYGEMVVYNHLGEIAKTVVPRYGRLVVMPCGLSHVIKPPALYVSQRSHSLNVYFQLSDKLVDQTAPDRMSMLEVFKERQELGLVTSESSSLPLTNTIEVEKYITSRFTTPDGHNIVILDNIIPEPILNALAYTVSNGVYTDFPAGPESTDDVQWILSFEVDHFLQTPLWPITHDIVTYISGRDTYYPYDIGCNNIQGRDSPKIHRDCEPGADDYTLLIYLNANWTENLHGETVFFSDMSGSDFLFAIKPKYGRVAIFHGTIPHSGRPPSLNYQGARFSFAVKMTASKKIALQKSLDLDIEPLKEALETAEEQEAKKIEQILHDISMGRLSKEEIESIVLKYEDKPTTREALIHS